MLLQHRRSDPGTGQDEAQNQSGRTSTNDTTPGPRHGSIHVINYSSMRAEPFDKLWAHFDAQESQLLTSAGGSAPSFSSSQRLVSRWWPGSPPEYPPRPSMATTR